MKSHQVVVFLGAPGAGKGALSRLCIEKFGWKQLSTGDLCRKHRAEGSEIGKQIDFALKSGTLVSDELIIDIVAEWVDQELLDSKSIILDGFPRTVAQADGFLKFLAHKHPEIKLVIIELRVPDHEIVERLSSRLICENRQCQAVFSTRTKELKSVEENVCTFCKSHLKQRDDDRPEVIGARLSTYHQHRDGLVHFYQNAGYVVHVVDGDRDNSEVFTSFLKHVGLS